MGTIKTLKVYQMTNHSPRNPAPAPTPLWHHVAWIAALAVPMLAAMGWAG